jgi:DNA polymerase-3 subunit alpha/error-prone DNA polymerase
MIPLLTRSYYSLMWGTASPEQLCAAARQHGLAKLALTDTDNLYGLWEFLRACRRQEISPIVGAEITEPHGDGRLACLVKDAQGFRNLCRLLTLRHRQEGFSLRKALPGLMQGLLVLSDQADDLAWLHDAGADLAAAMHQSPRGGYRLRQAARRLGVPLAAVPANYFLRPADYQVHRVLRAIALNTSLSRLTPGDLAPRDAWLASPREYARRFNALPEALAATHELAERLDFVLQPRTVMPPWDDPQGRDAHTALRQEAYAGAAGRYGQPLPQAAVQRLEYELDIIRQKDFSSYFLVVRDLVKRSPRICGRGSGAASLVAYCLGITNVCPLKFNLYFERFIHPQRVDPPDIDVDFAWDERDGVINSVLEQYQGRSAMVATHIFFQGRLAIREVAKVYGLPEQEIKRVMRRLPWLRGPVEGHTGFYPKRQALPPGAKADLAAPWPEVLAMAQAIVGIPRHLSVHVGGVVITPGPITDYAPLETAPKGVPVIQWEKDGAEEAGLVKIDLLGNRSLGVIRDAIANVRVNGRDFREAGWEPEDDPQTRELIAQGKTMGCFYIESPATRLLQQKAATGDFEHLVIHSSIIRPAANEYIQDYLHRLHGAAWQPIHPLLKDMLEETYGIMVYQEQVSQAAVALAGFTHAEGDRLRKIMTWKDKGRTLRDYQQKFFDGARRKGVDPATIEKVWQMMLSFSGYSFCKPHSASYARVSFQAAYLKKHFPAEFMAAVISNQGGFYSTFAYVSEARRLGLAILPPDVNQSQVRWTGEQGAVRVGLMAIKDLGRETRKRIVSQRRGMAFHSLDDFTRRVKPDEQELRALIHAGAFDALNQGGRHSDLLWQLACLGRGGAPLREEPQTDLFLREITTGPPLPPEARISKLRRQYQALGFLVDCHPMLLFADRLKGRGIVKAKDLPNHIGRRVRMAGWLLTGKTVWTKKNQPMQFLTFEDETGLVETTFFPAAYRAFCMILDYGRPYILKGDVDANFGIATMNVDAVGGG